MTGQKMLGFEAVWVLLRDFEICPALCSKKLLLEFCREIMTPTSPRVSERTGLGSFDAGAGAGAGAGGGAWEEGSVGVSTVTSRAAAWDEKKSKLCFVDLKKVGVWLAC
jgi:hypothetical protein